jgi:predicted lipoprotein
MPAGSNPDAGPAGDGARQRLLASASACIQRTLVTFADRATALEAAAAALVQAPGPDSRAAARTAYASAMEIWQRAEVMQLGPALPRASAGGQELRDNIYAWPSVNRCHIEQHLAAEDWAAADFPTSLVTGRGLGAIEYLLHYEGADNVCGASAPINATGQWAAIGPDDLARR